MKKDLYDFYTGTDGVFTSLAESFNAAAKKVLQKNPNKPFVVAAHSLGGALATLGALDGYVSGSFGGKPPLLITFGSLHLGDASFKQGFDSMKIYADRIANLCDFVPSFVALEPGPLTSYVHVGTECTFVWQKWDDWANHSMQFTYLPTVKTYLSVIQVGKRNYPQ